MNACAASNYAIGDGFDQISSGRFDVSIVGGVDGLSYLDIVGFNRLLSVTPDLCRPFDKNRKGMIVSEGAGFLVLEGKISPISSIKSMIGHTMGAAGAIEAIGCCLMLDHQEMLPTANYVTADPKCLVDCVPGKSRKAKLRHIISNSFAFGGNNSSVIFSKEEGRRQPQSNVHTKIIYNYSMDIEEASSWFSTELKHINSMKREGWEVSMWKIPQP